MADAKQDRWKSLAKEWGPYLAGSIRSRVWTRIAERHSDALGMPPDETKDFCLWLRDEWYPRQSDTDNVPRRSPPTKPAPQPPAQSSPVSDTAVHLKDHDKPYWYDQSRNLYVVHLPSRKHPIAISGDKWASIKDAYSNWSGSPASINEVSRKFGIARRTVLELLKVMGTTHDSSPWSEEVLGNDKEDVLVDDLLRRKEERILVKAERDNWNKIKKDAERWNNFERSVMLKFSSINKNGYTVPTVDIPNNNDRQFVAVISPTDFHYGKYSDGFEVGENDNRKLQRMRLIQSTEQVLSDVTKHGRPETIVIGIGSDFFNIDNIQKTTTDGTPQDVDGNTAEIVATGCKLMVEYIDMLRQVAPVSAVLMSGNHDRMLGVTLLMYLSAWYKNTPDVRVDSTSAAPRQYVEYGQNLLCFNHSDMGSKTSDLARLAAVERPHEWGRCANKMVFTGHFHSAKMEDDRGFTRFQLPSLSGTDRWHSQHGYVGSKKLLAAVLVDKYTGVFGTLYAEGD